VSKLILLSIIFMTVALPARAARQKNPRAGLRKAVITLVLFNLVYLFSLRFLWGRI